MNFTTVLTRTQNRKLFVNKTLSIIIIPKKTRFFAGYHESNYYQPGLNICSDKEFTNNKINYVDENNLHLYGPNAFIRQVYLPKSDPFLKLKYLHWNNSWVANKVILSDKQYSMNNLTTYTDLDLDLSVYKNAINRLASLEGRVDVLIKMESKRLLTMSNENIWSACINGHISIIEFFERKYDIYNKHFTKDKNFAYILTKNNDITILNWMLKSQLVLDSNFAYDERCVDIASSLNNINLLNWWLNYSYNHSNQTFKYSHIALDSASENGYIDVLRWWEKVMIERGINLLYTENSMNKASLNKRIDVLNWWLHMNKYHGIPLKYDRQILSKIEPRIENFIVFKWWILSGLLLLN